MTLFLNTFLSLRLTGEYDYLWKYEVNTLKGVFLSKFEGIHLFSGYYEAFPLTVILSFTGQLILVGSLFIKNRKNKVIKTGILFLWMGLFNIMIAGFGGFLSVFFLFLSIIPFALISICLYWLARKQSNSSIKT